jgi:hypothetical protein
LPAACTCSITKGCRGAACCATLALPTSTANPSLRTLDDGLGRQSRDVFRPTRFRTGPDSRRCFPPAFRNVSTTIPSRSTSRDANRRLQHSSCEDRTGGGTSQIRGSSRNAVLVRNRRRRQRCDNRHFQQRRYSLSGSERNTIVFHTLDERVPRSEHCDMRRESQWNERADLGEQRTAFGERINVWR